jgi:DNA processing protein
MNLILEEIKELSSMKKYPKQIYFSGDKELLNCKKISIVGTRKPSKYTRELTFKLASKLSKSGVVVVSGGAIGVDAIAHRASLGEKNTICVLPCGIDIRYPSINKNLLNDIEKNALLLSQFEYGFRSTPWSFVSRNELVVSLGEVLVVCEADLDSGSMRSVEFALKMGKKIYVLPHRAGESEATNKLLKDKKAEAIFDVDEFVAKFAEKKNTLEIEESDFVEYCKTNPSYEEAIKKYPTEIFEAELNGEIKILNSKVHYL